MKAEAERPEALDALDETPPATPRAGGRKSALRASARLAPAWSVPSGNGRSGRSPRQFLAASAPRQAPGVQGAQPPALVDGCPEGEPTSPSGRSRCRNTGRGPGRESPGRGLQGGATAPLLDGSRESRSLPGRDATARRCVSRDGLDARQRQRRLNNPLARRSSKSGRALGIALGGPRGMGNPPARWARYYRAHLVRFEWRRPAILYYGRKNLKLW